MIFFAITLSKHKASSECLVRNSIWTSMTLNLHALVITSYWSYSFITLLGNTQQLCFPYKLMLTDTVGLLGLAMKQEVLIKKKKKNVYLLRMISVSITCLVCRSVKCLVRNSIWTSMTLNLHALVITSYWSYSFITLLGNTQQLCFPYKLMLTDTVGFSNETGSFN